MDKGSVMVRLGDQEVFEERYEERGGQATWQGTFTAPARAAGPLQIAIFAKDRRIHYGDDSYPQSAKRRNPGPGSALDTNPATIAFVSQSTAPYDWTGYETGSGSTTGWDRNHIVQVVQPPAPPQPNAPPLPGSLTFDFAAGSKDSCIEGGLGQRNYWGYTLHGGVANPSEGIGSIHFYSRKGCPNGRVTSYTRGVVSYTLTGTMPQRNATKVSVQGRKRHTRGQTCETYLDSCFSWGPLYKEAPETVTFTFTVQADGSMKVEPDLSAL